MGIGAQPFQLALTSFPLAQFLINLLQALLLLVFLLIGFLAQAVLMLLHGALNIFLKIALLLVEYIE